MAALSKVLGGLQLSPAVQKGAIVAAALGGAYLLTFIHFARYHRFSIPGESKFPIPIVGGLIEMVRNPTRFWDRQEEQAKGNMSWLSIAWKFVVFATKADHCQRIFQANGPDSLSLVLHPNGRIILGDSNIAFMSGPDHKALRGSFLHLFTPKALALYLVLQEACIRKHLKAWIELHPHTGAPTEMRDRLRDLNVETSVTVFIGKYLDDPVAFAKHYVNMTKGFLTAPIYFPGTGLYKAVQSRKVVVRILDEVVQRSKRAMSLPGANPECLVDFWTQGVLEAVEQAKQTGEAPPDYSGNIRMAETVMDFLFASQDATTAALSQLVATMSKYPKILERVRAEQAAVRGNDPLTYDSIQQLPYTRQCVLEQLRLVPPAPMVPMIVNKDFKLSDDYTAKKGTYIIPSLVASCHEGFPDPLAYDPDRMGPERHEDVTFAKQFIPFGVGPHRCVGYNYAIQQLTAFLAILASSAEWRRTLTPNSDEILYLPTLYPHDCLCTWASRELRH